MNECTECYTPLKENECGKCNRCKSNASDEEIEKISHEFMDCCDLYDMICDIEPC